MSDRGHDSPVTPGPIRRFLEGVAINVVSAAVLWLGARATGLVQGNPVATLTASGVAAGGLVTIAASYVVRRENVLWRVREIVNFINLSTPAGVLMALIGGAKPHRTASQYRMIHAFPYQLRWPRGTVFTLGNVVVSRRDTTTLPAEFLYHERRHSTQYAWCLGILALIPYTIACGWSWLLTGSFSARNVFEKRAGNGSGGYYSHPLRPLSRRAWWAIGVGIGVVLGGCAWVMAQLFFYFL
ncbi:hypothetical protein [Paractinoplanes durhamensis]|uniref:hypothetical protein n=1 Tax=Paractinoplanes durhamensis TaxID=113563 RepID=UPI0019453650|nr:hypothetical protein [Actinoplanes durhamensis]